ncbi:MAG: hypothetical protein JRI45_06965 [Deltaproteobacteria bacterium]|nr:hypothetical protein [Deltaproteobacteria bacterium]MBW2068683.1 hypothetical protein [Deltaproteobacteria bacterium]
MSQNQDGETERKGRQPDPLLEVFFDPSVPLPEICWETVPHYVDPYTVWNGYDENVHGWVFVWYPVRDPLTGRSFQEFERAQYFHNDLVRILKEMRCWPLWGSRRHQKRMIAFALLQLYCEVGDNPFCQL